MPFDLLNSFLFLATLPFVLFLPGWAIVFFIERKNNVFTSLERFVLSVATSFVGVDGLLLTLDWLHLPITRGSVFVGLTILSALFFLLGWHGRKGKEGSNFVTKERISLAFLMLFLILLVFKTVYTWPSVIPSSTDLGHHMYWVKRIALEGHIPLYTEREIVQDKTKEGTYLVGEPEPISDFIVGEHLALAAIGLLSGMEFISLYPILTLFFVHLITLLAIYVLARRLFEASEYREKIALLAMLLLGILYTFAPPQMKYILGGVIGNTYGNLFIPAIFLLLILALRSRRADFLSLATLLMFALAYTHHLSTLLFGIVLASTVFFLLILKPSSLRENLFPLLWSKVFLTTAGACFLFFFFAWTPSYIKNQAVETVLGTPVNTEHLGITFSQLKFAVGEPRMVFGLLGLLLLLSHKAWRRSETTALLLAWALPWMALILKPDLFRIDLPSERIANYLIFPLVLLAAFALTFIFEKIRSEEMLPRFLRSFVFLLLLVFVLHNGIFDNSQYLLTPPGNTEKMSALFNAAPYLVRNISSSENIVHDHVNILGDSWLKLFFMRDYNFPFYRANLFRYDRITDKQEKCTLYIISAPSTKDATHCLEDLNVKAVLVNEALDGEQFRHFSTFWPVYQNNFYSIYWYAPKK